MGKNKLYECTIHICIEFNEPVTWLKWLQKVQGTSCHYFVLLSIWSAFCFPNTDRGWWRTNSALVKISVFQSFFYEWSLKIISHNMRNAYLSKCLQARKSWQQAVQFDQCWVTVMKIICKILLSLCVCVCVCQLTY